MTSRSAPDGTPRCVLCEKEQALTSPPEHGLRYVELAAVVYGLGFYVPGRSNVVCAGCARSNIDDVFYMHRACVEEATP